MLLWFVFAVLTAGVVIALLRPWRADASGRDAEMADVAVYRDQLSEIEADRERGAIDAAEAAAARAEVARRILGLAGGGSEPPAKSASRSGTRSEHGAGGWIAVAIAAGLPIAAAALYVVQGAPGLPGQPAAGRKASPGDQQSILALVAEVEARLRTNPEDGRGWDAIAPIYKGMRRFADAAASYANANRILGETPKRLAGFAESEILANDGRVTPNARLAAERLEALEPGRPDAALWLALAKEQDGDLAAALAGYRAILDGGVPSGPLREAIEARSAALAERIGNAGSPAPAPQASASESAAAGSPEAIAALPPDEQAAFVEGMVARLRARLEKEPGDVEGWIRLLRAYDVMGRKADAADALEKARAGLAGNTEATARLEEAAKAFGLGAQDGAGGGS